MPVVLEVEELIVPLGDNPQGIFDECAHDQETAHGWDVSTELTPVSTSPSTTVTEPHSLALQAPNLHRRPGIAEAHTVL